MGCYRLTYYPKETLTRVHGGKTSREKNVEWVWLSVDPHYFNYPTLTPYAYVANNPVMLIDPDGRKIVFAQGVSKEFKAAFAQAVQHLNKHGAADMMAQLESSETVYNIGETSGGSFYDPKDRSIHWDPSMAVITNEGAELSPTSILNHEVDHALQHDQNPEQLKKDARTPDAQYGNKEERRVITGSEQETAKKLGEIKDGQVTRKDHEGQLYETTSPTSTEWKNVIIVTPEKE